eukprot:gene2281-3245_t
MNKVTFYHKPPEPGISQCLFKLHKDIFQITWHPVEHIPIDTKNSHSNAFPRSNTKTLLAVEDLGRGSTGKAWLLCTLTV